LISWDRALKTALQYSGFLLVLLLCSEEFRRLVTWFSHLIRQNPRLRFWLYPLAALVAIGVAALIANSFITLFISVLISYD
jgi:hypothetical protein